MQQESGPGLYYLKVLGILFQNRCGALLNAEVVDFKRRFSMKRRVNLLRVAAVSQRFINLKLKGPLLHEIF